METIARGGASSAQIDQLDQIAEHVDPEMHDLLMSIARCLRAGNDIVAVDPGGTMTPTQVASRLGMSRTHLYKLLDAGEMPSHRVGRDRRIRVADVMAFEGQRQRDRRELAERFAHQKSHRDAAVDELAELL